MEKVKEVAAKKGLDIEILEFSDYVVPNQALADGDLNANSFQHQPYLDNQIADRGFDLVAIGKTITTPMGVYSKKVKSLGELADGASVAIPNDPTNGGRALLILAKEGLIKIKPEAGLAATPNDVIRKPEEHPVLRTRRRPASPLAGRRRCRRHQHQLRAGSRPASEDRRHRH